MRAFIILVVASIALGSPISNEELQRVKKSYGAEGYAPPCAGATPLAPVALYLSPQTAPVLAHYRADEHGEEESEHARSYYGPAPAIPSYGAAAAAPASAPAVGIFPNAKLTGCAIPLLLSCAPSVHSGHLAHAAPVGSAYGGEAVPVPAPAVHASYPTLPALPALPSPVPSYRNEDHKMRETSQWSDAARSPEDTVSGRVIIGEFPRNPAQGQVQAQL